MKQNLLIFSLGTHQRFAVDVANTKEIVTLGDLSQIPGSSALVLGVTRVRDAVIPVIDTQAILFKKLSIQKPLMAIVLDLGEPIALAVSAVSHVHKFDPELHAHDEGKGTYVELVIQDHQGLIQKLTAKKLFSRLSQAQTPLQERAA